MRLQAIIHYLALAVVASAMTAPAEASTYLITYTGTVTSGYDQTGVFGNGQSNLTGKEFNAVYTLNYPAPVASETNDGTRREIYSGSVYSAASVISSVALSINNVTQTIEGPISGTSSSPTDTINLRATISSLSPHTNMVLAPNHTQTATFPAIS